MVLLVAPFQANFSCIVSWITGQIPEKILKQNLNFKVKNTREVLSPVSHIQDKCYIRSNAGQDSQTKFEFQTKNYLNILKISLEGEGSERFRQMNWGMGL
jgi:hypothetical protein